MRRTLIVLLFLVLPFPLAAERTPITRAEGFRILWEPLRRSIEEVREEPFQDVLNDHPHFKLLTFGKARQMLDDEDTFRPERPLHLKDALLWLLRSRNVDAPSDITDTTLLQFLAYYPLLEEPLEILAENPTVNVQELTQLIEKLDTFLREERHTVSFYAEEFAGKGTAFGETFDPTAFTAAHRYLPYNILVRVTYRPTPQDCKPSSVACHAELAERSVVVRINDRGPYIDGRDMDLSLAAFEKLAPRSTGVLTNVTFERLGDAPMVAACTDGRAAWPQSGFTRYQRRLGRTLLDPGIPRRAMRGGTLQLSGNQSFRVLQVLPPRGKPIRYEKWTRRGEEVTIHFVQPGTYVLVLLADSGKRQRFRTEVSESCS